MPSYVVDEVGRSVIVVLVNVFLNYFSNCQLEEYKPLYEAFKDQKKITTFFLDLE
jgi:hypothetical protein